MSAGERGSAAEKREKLRERGALASVGESIGASMGDWEGCDGGSGT